MKIYVMFLYAFGIALLGIGVFVVAKIYPNKTTNIIKNAPIIKHDPGNIFEFAKGNGSYADMIGNASTLNLHEDGKDYSNLTFDAFLEKETKTSAFVVIRKDSVLYEKYFDKYSEDTQFPSYSLAKPFIATLTGMLIEDGVIPNINEPVVNYIEELRNKGSYWDELTIAHLLNMESGLKFQEVGRKTLPYFGFANLYLANNAMRIIEKATFEKRPGIKQDQYSSLNTQILGMVLESASGKPILELMEERIWTQIGMQADARWSYDSRKHKNMRTYCCIKATAMDYARFGRLYLNKGNWNGKQIVPTEWVEESTTRTYKTQWYHYHWMLLRGRDQIFYVEGLYGQFIYIYPKTETIYIRLGKKNDMDSREIFNQIESMLYDENKLVDSNIMQS